MIPDESNLLDRFAELCDGTISDADFAALQSRLESDADARKLYIQYMSLHADLAFSEGALSALNTQSTLEEAANLAGPAAGAMPAPEVWPDLPKQPAERGVIFRIGLGVAAAVVLAVTLVLAFRAADESNDPAAIATITPSPKSQLDTVFQSGDALPQGQTIRLSAGSATVAFHSGPKVTLTGATELRLDSKSQTTLLSGAVAASVPPQAVGFTVDAPNLRVIDLGTRFGVLVPPKGGDTEVHVFAGKVEVQPRIRLPRLFYSFDETGPTASDPFSLLPGALEGSAKRAKGIIGSGAIEIDNQPHSCVRIGNGGSSQQGQGVFGDVREGLTIEVMIIPRFEAKGWSVRGPKPYDYDEIFRKEDGLHRMLLCFQDDTGAEQPIVPVVDPGPCLTFGLYLDGLGYSELDMPLDGQQGRPTLAELKDGKPHHVVASYDVATGIKAIYIDGTLRFRHRFPAGTRVIAGGDAVANIGNHYRFADEAFNGVIDEFAFYNAALTPAEVAGHWRNVQAGRNYFGVSQFGHDAAGPTAKLPLNAGQAMRFDRDTGLPAAPITPDAKAFGQ